MIIAISASSPAEFSIIEAPTITLAEGTEIVIYNRNRNSNTNIGELRKNFGRLIIQDTLSNSRSRSEAAKKLGLKKIHDHYLEL